MVTHWQANALLRQAAGRHCPKLQRICRTALTHNRSPCHADLVAWPLVTLIAVGIRNTRDLTLTEQLYDNNLLRAPKKSSICFSMTCSCSARIE
jgi:hypothetical protein